MRNLVAVYGTLRKGFGLNALLKSSNLVGVEHHPVPYRMVNVGSYPALLPTDEDNRIFFEIYAVDDSTLSRLDLAEGVPHLYNRRTVDIHGMECYIYVFTDVEWGEKLEPIPSGDFKDYINNRLNISNG